MQYFVKLLLVGLEKPVLLFGFCAPTWKHRDVHFASVIASTDSSQKLIQAFLRSEFYVPLLLG